MKYSIEKTESKKEESEDKKGGEETKAKACEHKEEPSKLKEEKKDPKATSTRALDNSIFRKLGNWKEGEYKQTYSIRI